MPLYRGKALTSEGEKISFAREAASRRQLLAELRSQGLLPLRIRSRGGEAGRLKRQIPTRAVLDFTDTLSLLLASGLSLKDALAIMLTIFRSGPVHRAAARILDRIRKGASLFQALESYEVSFPPIYRGLVKIGEKIGSLENVFARLSAYLREKKQFRDRMVGAMLYPALVLAVALVGIGLLGVFIIPKMEEIYSQIGVGLPGELASRMAVLRRLLFLLPAGVTALLAAALGLRFAYRRSADFAEAWDGLVLRLPIVGRVGQYRDTLTFLFAMETLTDSGYPVEDALEEAAASVGNRALRRCILAIESRIKRGGLLSQAFLEQALLPERIGQWLVIGERSGKVELVFRQLRNYYQEEIAKWSTRTMALAEPAFMVLVGAVIVLFVFVFVLPIFSVYQSFL